MATQETKIVDNIIASRRALLIGGGAALAAFAVPNIANAASTVTAYTDNDILNFALNLEYLEANFYYYAAFGVPITSTSSLITGAGGLTGIGIGTGTSASTGAGAITIKTTSPKVPFANTAVAAYATETAIQEGKHVSFLRSQLGTNAVAQPALDLQTSFAALGTMIGVANYDPFLNDAYFLLGAYIFEDVGVTAYKGAAPLITSKAVLGAAASILATEAYHAGLIRSTLTLLDPLNANGYLGLTQKISAVRASASLAANTSAPNPDDYGLYPGTYPQTGSAIPVGTVNLGGTAGFTAVPATNIADADPTNVVAFSRNTTQVLNIVTVGKATTPATKAVGGFFPAGMNGTFS